jgi:alkanesulfonate monooxygenase SsuD/methylene tetrahydromethanopterin reductase-like flavin-dependent oxidoreductase (luciferase family)
LVTEVDMRVSVVILPIYDRASTSRIWRLVEDMGFDAAFTYDHLAWRTFQGSTWFGAVPTLSAAAVATERIRLGTLVSSADFRHPVPFAADLMSLDHLSGGRLTVGVGAGVDGYDSVVLGRPPITAAQRSERFAEFVSLLSRLLSGEQVDHDGVWYRARMAELAPGCVQQPRAPLTVAATGPKGMRVVAEHAQTWVTYGRPRSAGGAPADGSPAAVAEQVTRLIDACGAAGRDPATLERAYLAATPAQALASTSAYVDMAGRYAELGMTEFIVHYPVPGTVLDADIAVFERLADDALDTVRRMKPAAL